MVKTRIPETNEGIQGGSMVALFDRFARNMRDKGWNNVQSIIDSGIRQGSVLEIGPGPGYIGLEWLTCCPGAKLTACEISREMIKIAERNAMEYGLDASARYVEGNCMNMPFEDNSFDAAFSNGSLHEWEDPIKVFTEIARVVKEGGTFCITDMRRNINPILKWMMYSSTKPREIKPGFITSLNASYTSEEISVLLEQSKIKNYSVEKDFFGLRIFGKI